MWKQLGVLTDAPAGINTSPLRPGCAYTGPRPASTMPSPVCRELRQRRTGILLLCMCYSSVSATIYLQFQLNIQYPPMSPNMGKFRLQGLHLIRELLERSRRQVSDIKQGVRDDRGHKKTNIWWSYQTLLLRKGPLKKRIIQTFTITTSTSWCWDTQNDTTGVQMSADVL